jgi:hypothetical protein
MVIELVPIKSKYSSQIEILEEFALSLVAFLVPANSLAFLVAVKSVFIPT